MTQEESHLDLLGIFHFVLGGFTALFSCIPFIHLFIGLAMVSGAFSGDEEFPRFLGWFFVVLPGLFILAGWTLAGCMIVAGTKLRKRTSYTFCLVIACLECLLVPFGTLLGVFTLVTLSNEKGKALFRAGTFAGTFPAGAGEVVR